MKELIESMYQRKDFGPHVVPEYLYSQLNRWVPFKPEALKLTLDAMAQDAGVDVRFFTRVIDAEATDRRVEGAVISNVEGYRFIRAKAFIDCTGDAALRTFAAPNARLSFAISRQSRRRRYARCFQA